MRVVFAWLAVVLSIGVMPRDARAQDETLARTLALVGQRVEAWYGRAQSLVSRETVVIQPLRADFAPAEPPRRLSFDLRVGWEAVSGGAGSPVASVLRQPVSQGGRARLRDEDPGCMDPKPTSPEPLAMLLPERQQEYRFAAAGTGRVDGRRAVQIDYRSVSTAPADITWTDECVSMNIPAQSRGRVWIDVESYDVLRLDERLEGAFTLDVPRDQVRRGAASTMVVERAESSIRYKPVTFQDPHESLLLPASIDTLTVIRGRGVQRVRMTQRFSDYRRFLTTGRMVD